MQFEITFRTPEQKEFFNVTMRNSCFSGGFGNGKTYIGCEKLMYLLLTFPRYRVVIARFEESKLKQTTLQTFFKVCKPEFYDPAKGGNRADSQNTCRLCNGSEILWMNLKDTDEGMVRGLEVNSVLVDQAEEISEKMYLMLSARVGRWDRAQVPNELLKKDPNWPLDPRTLNPKVPSYMMILCNPDSELHWIHRRFHPDSEEFQRRYHKNHVMIQAASTTATIDEELLQEMMENDPSWVNRFVLGKWGIPGGQIHAIRDESVLTPGIDISFELIEEIIKKGKLSRVLDHGDAAPTCCLWFSAYKEWYFCYREYYKPNALISEHRIAISDLSRGETYLQNLIDPQCAKKTLQKYGGTWTHIDEYADRNIDAPPLFWEPADNNEFATRNRISELLRNNTGIRHPINSTEPAPKLYFIKRTPEFSNGCFNSISQLKSQKRLKIGDVDGREIYSDERDPTIPDHAYDPIRYYIASHSSGPSSTKPKPPAGSFFDVRKRFIALKQARLATFQ